MSQAPHEERSATLLYLLTMLTPKEARKVVRNAGNNGFEAYRKLCLMYGTSDQEGSTGLFANHNVKFGCKIEDVEDRLNEFLELVRRYDETNGTDPVPDQVKKACIISNTREPLKTHLQLHVSKLGTFDALRMATEDYLKSRRSSRRSQLETLTKMIRWKSMSSPGKGKAKKNFKGKKGGKKSKKQSRWERLRKNDSRTFALRWRVSKLRKTRASRNQKVTEIGEGDNSKQVEETWTPNKSSQPSSSSQANTIGEIGCADDGMWIFSLEDCQKRRHTVNWKVGSRSETCDQAEEHELTIDSGCFGHVCPPWLAPHFPMVSSTHVEAMAANNEALRHFGQKVIYGHVTTNSGRRVSIQNTFDVVSVRKPLLSTHALKRRGVTIIFNHDYDRIIFRNETVTLISHRRLGPKSDREK